MSVSSFLFIGKRNTTIKWKCLQIFCLQALLIGFPPSTKTLGAPIDSNMCLFYLHSLNCFSAGTTPCHCILCGFPWQVRIVVKFFFCFVCCACSWETKQKWDSDVQQRSQVRFKPGTSWFPGVHFSCVEQPHYLMNVRHLLRVCLLWKRDPSSVSLEVWRFIPVFGKSSLMWTELLGIVGAICCTDCNALWG